MKDIKKARNFAGVPAEMKRDGVGRFKLYSGCEEFSDSGDWNAVESHKYGLYLSRCLNLNL